MFLMMMVDQPIKERERPERETPERPRCPDAYYRRFPRAMEAAIYRATNLGHELVPTAAYTFSSWPYPTIPGLNIHMGSSSWK